MFSFVAFPFVFVFQLLGAVFVLVLHIFQLSVEIESDDVVILFVAVSICRLLGDLLAEFCSA